MKESFLEDLENRLVTKEDLIVLFQEINFAENLVFKDANKPLSEKLERETGREFTNFIKKLEKRSPHFHSPNQQLIFFQNLKKNLKRIPLLKLEIAFEPTAEFLTKIKQWFSEENRQTVILDLSIRPEIVGGTIVEYRGQYCNFSVAKKIDELFSKKL